MAQSLIADWSAGCQQITDRMCSGKNHHRSLGDEATMDARHALNQSADRSGIMAILIVASCACALFAGHAGASAIPDNQTAPTLTKRDAALQVADVRDYRHCHNTPRHTYCHTRGCLPVGKISCSSSKFFKRSKDVS
jgi:hypothetical protein